MTLAYKSLKPGRAWTAGGYVFLLLVCALTVTQLATVLIARKSWIFGGVIVYPHSRTQPLPAYLELAKQNDVILVPSEAPQSRMVRDQAARISPGAVTTSDVFGMFERPHGLIQYRQGAAALIPMVDAVATQNSVKNRPTLQWALALAAFAIGWRTKRFWATNAPLVPMVLAVLSAALLKTRCQVCVNTDTIFGIDLALLGVLCFGALSALSFRLGTFAVIAVSLGLSLSASIQAILFSQADHLCDYCMTIFVLSSCFLGAATANKGELSVKTVRPRFAAGSSLAAGSLVVYLLFFGTNIGRAVGIHTGVPVSAPKIQSLLGRSIGSLGIRRQPEQKAIEGPAVVLVGTDTCQACRWALRWASSENFARFYKVAQFEKRQGEVTAKPAYWLDPSDTPLPTPSLLLVSKEGRIVDEIYGWAEDVHYKSALRSRFELALRAEHAEPRKRKETDQ